MPDLHVEGNEGFEAQSLGVDDFDEALDVDLLVVGLVGLLVVDVQVQGDVHQLPPVVEDLGVLPGGELEDLLPALHDPHVDVLEGLVDLLLDLVLEGVDPDGNFEVLPDLEVVVVVDGLEEAEVAADRVVADVGLQPLGDDLSLVLLSELLKVAELLSLYRDHYLLDDKQFQYKFSLAYHSKLLAGVDLEGVPLEDDLLGPAGAGQAEEDALEGVLDGLGGGVGVLEGHEQAEVAVEVVGLPVEVLEDLFVELGQVLLVLAEEAEGGLHDHLVLEEVLAEGEHHHLPGDLPVVLVEGALVGGLVGVDVADHHRPHELPLPPQHRQVQQVEDQVVPAVDLQHHHPLRELLPELVLPPVLGPSQEPPQLGQVDRLAVEEQDQLHLGDSAEEVEEEVVEDEFFLPLVEVGELEGLPLADGLGP